MSWGLLEQLSALEHERWAAWQGYLHARCTPSEDGSLVIPAYLVRRWERQAATKYQKLSDEDRDRARGWVETTWPRLSEIVTTFLRRSAEFRRGNRIEPNDAVAELDRLRAERDEARRERDAALADAERLLSAMAMYGSRLRELESAAAKLARAQSVLDAVARWHEVSTRSVEYPSDSTGMIVVVSAALRAVVEAWDDYVATEAGSTNG